MSSRPQHAPAWVAPQRLRVIPPSIDPLPDKNRHLAASDCVRLLAAAGLLSVSGSDPWSIVQGASPPAPDAPLVVQVSRWDRLKDMPGVMAAFAAASLPTDVRLMLVGPAVAGVTDDPEGAQVLAESSRAGINCVRVRQARGLSSQRRPVRRLSSEPRLQLETVRWRGTRTTEDWMTSEAHGAARILGSLRSADGKGVVRMEDRVESDIGDVWSAITDPARLGRWYGEVEGDLRLGGEYHARLFASGWEGTGHIAACEPPRRLVVSGKDPDEPNEGVTEVTLTADGDHTVVVWEERGMPLNLLAAYGAGIQIHVEDLIAHLSGRERCDPGTRWNELEPAYEALAANLG